MDVIDDSLGFDENVLLDVLALPLDHLDDDPLGITDRALHGDRNCGNSIGSLCPIGQPSPGVILGPSSELAISRIPRTPRFIAG